MPKRKLNGSVYIKSLPGGVQTWEFNSASNKVFCKACTVDFNYANDNLKFRITSHIKTEKHISNSQLSSRQQLLSSSSSTESNDYFSDLTVALMKANIPINAVENETFKDFLEKYTGKKSPSQSLLRKSYLPRICEKSLEASIESFKNSPYYIIVDEATDACGRNVCAGLVGSFNSVEKPTAVDIAELCDTNHRTIVQFVNNVNAKVAGDDFSNLKLLITDGASYMLKAGSILKETFDDLCHVTCISHALHRLAEFVRSKHPLCDEFVSLMKKLLRKNNFNKKLYKEMTKLPLPRHPITTRWGTWLESAFFYSENIDAILHFIDNVDSDQSAASLKIHQLVHNQRNSLKSKLSDLQSLFQFLPSTIKKLQARQPIADVISILDNVKVSLPNEIYSEKWEKIIGKNPDLSTVLRRPLFALAPVVSVDVERFFSSMSAILSPERQLLSLEALKQHLILNWNNL